MRSSFTDKVPQIEGSPEPSIVRKFLENLYLASGMLAAACIVGVAIATVAQILGRVIGVTIDSTETASFLLAGSTFLGLAYTFRINAQIRVSLLVDSLSLASRRVLDIWSTALFVLIVAYLVYWTFDLAYFSWKYKEISSGIVAIPLWIPRSSMALGTFVLLIAAVDTLIELVSGRRTILDKNTK